MFYNKQKYYALLVTKINEAYTKIKRIKIDALTKSFYYKNKRYFVNTSIVTYKEKNKNYYFIDAVTKNQINYIKKDNIIDINLVDAELEKNTLEQLIKGSLDKQVVNPYILIFCIIVSGLLMYFVGNYFPLPF